MTHITPEQREIEVRQPQYLSLSSLALLLEPTEEINPVTEAAKEKLLENLPRWSNYQVFVRPNFANLPEAEAINRFTAPTKVTFRDKSGEIIEVLDLNPGDIILTNTQGETLSRLLQEYFPEIAMWVALQEDIEQLLFLELDLEQAVGDAFQNLDVEAQQVLQVASQLKTDRFNQDDFADLIEGNELEAAKTLEVLEYYFFIEQNEDGSYSFVTEKIKALVAGLLR